MEIHRTESEGWLTNAYLIEDGRAGVLVDGNGVGAPLLRIASDRGVRVEAVLVTHHHLDHVMFDDYAGLDVPYFGHRLTAAALGRGRITNTIADGEVLRFGTLTIEALFTPGHANGHLAFMLNGTDLLTADLLFRGTVGGTRGPQATGLDDLRASLRRLAALPAETRVHPGHREPTTIGDELDRNVFLRALLADAKPAGRPCSVAGQPATLLLWGPDYDGTNKAWVRLSDGVEHITGGSQVKRG